MNAELSDQEFASLQGEILDQHGIFLREEQRPYLTRRVRERAAALGLDSLAQYVERIIRRDPEAQALIERVVVLETYFFRYAEQFALLRTQFFPELLRSRRAQGDYRFRAWSAGCASGEEAYSLVMAFAEAVGAWEGWTIDVLGTDLCGGFLDMARQARYGTRSFRERQARELKRFIEPVAEDFSVSERIRRFVRFERLNLARDPYPNGMDLVFCRNVLIYFSDAKAQEVLQRLVLSLNPGGVLCLGPTETLLQVPDGVELVQGQDAICYRRMA